MDILPAVLVHAPSANNVPGLNMFESVQSSLKPGSAV